MYFIIALILSLVITPLAIKLNILDKPNYRKIHTKPIPKAGGLGIFIPYILLITFIGYKNGFTRIDLGIICITSFLLVVGVIDDKIELSSKVKLLLQAVAAGVSIAIGLTFNITEIWIIDYIITFVWYIGMINAVNLIDGLDGLAAGVGIFSSIAFLIAGIVFENMTIITISSIIIGGSIGFLKYNFRPAKIFMGDTGSLPLGFNLAILGILSTNEFKEIDGLLFTVIVLALPIFDTLLSMYRRYRNNKPIFAPDRSHFYNLLMDLKGIEHKNVVLTLYAINIVLIFLALLYIKANFTIRVFEFVLIIILSIYLVVKNDFIKVDKTN